MNQVATVAIGAAQLASNLGGVPALGVAASAAAGIQAACQKVVVHKKRCETLSNKTAQLLYTIEAQASTIDAEQMRGAVDQVAGVLQRVNGRVTKWAQCSRVQAFLRDGKIGDGLKQCESEIDTALQQFTITAHVHMANAQSFLVKLLEKNQDEWRSFSINQVAETRSLVLQILQSPQDLQVAAEMHRVGKPAAERLMEVGQQRLADPTANSSSKDREMWKNGLSELQRLTGIPPTLKILDGEVVKTSELPAGRGGHSLVWPGLWFGKKVALKVLHGIEPSDRAKARFVNEIRIWAGLRNRHIQPLYGIVTDMSQFLHTVSPWQDNGTLLEYVQANPSVSKGHLLLGAARGLAYLHGEQIVHGNVRCANILVTSEGETAICDFGMSTIIGEITNTPVAATLTTAGSTRWLAPELIFDEANQVPTFSCDTWSFGMTMLECYTMRPPWEDVRRDAHIIQVMGRRSQLPARPRDTTSPTDAVWALMIECWNWEPDKRPAMSDVAMGLFRCIQGARGSIDTEDLR